QVLSTTLPDGSVPANVLVGFTAGTGSLHDRHAISGVGVSAGGQAVRQPGGGWRYNGVAGMSGSDNLLTPAAPNGAGSVVFGTPVKTSGLTLQFDVQLSGGNDGYGVTFALLDPAKSSATSLGADGPRLGLGGLTGVAAIMVSKIFKGYPTSNFIATTIRSNGKVLVIQNLNRNIGPLRTGTHTVGVHITSSKVLQIWLDGELVIQQPEPRLTSTALLAFTGGTGDGFQNQVVRDVAISAQAP
ncbi:MAG TPA: hypothetical protein VF979_00520, partial [Streptosporangiaceae bacterium]